MTPFRLPILGEAQVRHVTCPTCNAYHRLGLVNGKWRPTQEPPPLEILRVLIFKVAGVDQVELSVDAKGTRLFVQLVPAKGVDWADLRWRVLEAIKPHTPTDVVVAVERGKRT
jgi:hypothetical protein